MGSGEKKVLTCEVKARKFARRSIVAYSCTAKEDGCASMPVPGSGPRLLPPAPSQAVFVSFVACSSHRRNVLAKQSSPALKAQLHAMAVKQFGCAGASCS